jgi:hypothetical protein
MDLGAKTIVEVLKLGLSGFAFLMMWFSYLLLSAEQRRNENPRPGIVRAVYVFMVASFAFAVLVASNATFGLIQQSANARLEGQIAQCRDRLEVLESLSRLEKQSVEDLRVAIGQSVGLCEPLLRQLDSELAIGL